MLMWSLLVQAAWPCVSMYHFDKQLAESDAQAIVFAQVPEGVQVSYQVSFFGDATSFGWLIPVFGEFVSLEDGDSAVFEELYRLTQPQVDYIYASEESSAGGGCSRMGKGDLALSGRAFGDTGAANDAVVIAEGFTGSYAYQILDSTDKSAFLAWLDENGWSPNGSESTLDAYIAEGGVQFAAITLSEASGDQLPPITITHTGDTLRVPMAMAQHAPVDALRTILYVQGENTAVVTGDWSASPLGTIAGDFSDVPTQLYDETLLAVGGNSRSFGLVYSGRDVQGTGWVTRFETLAYPGAHTADAVLTLGDSPTSQQTTIVLQENGSAQGAWLLLPLAALGLGLTRRRD